MNYQALGEFTAFSEQAKDAADRRFALLHNLGSKLLQLSKSEKVIDFTEIEEQLAALRSNDAQLYAAVERANQAAALAVKTPLSLHALCNK